MRIFQNLEKLSDISTIISTPGISKAFEYWSFESLNEKSSIDLRIFQTPLPSISLLYGPRQIGKTSALRQFLFGVRDCETLIYLDCSILLERRELYQSLKEMIKGPTTIVLDEVQVVDGWHIALRTLHGEGLLKSCRIWCTGSESRHILESGERLPGRKGSGKVVFARPWTFREFVDFFFTEEAESLKDVDYKHVNQAWLNSRPLLLEEAWQEYCLTGGIPHVVGEFKTKNRISDEVWRVYIDWILGSWTQLRTPERSLRQLSSRLMECLNSRVSYEQLKKGSDIQSGTTIKSLLDMQEDHFAIRVLPKYDWQKKKFLPAKQKKIYPVDPFIARVWQAIGARVNRNFSQMVELPQIDETAFFAQTLSYNYRDDTGYLYSSRTQSEVDFYFGECAFELKSAGSPTKNQWGILNECEQAFVIQGRHLPIMSYLVGESRLSKDDYLR